MDSQLLGHHPISYKSDKFPFEEAAIDSFNKLKELLSKATLAHIDESQPFLVECDASDISLSDTLNQGGRPIAFMSRTFTGSEKYYAPVEKEATAIIEAVRKWAHLFSSHHFKIVTDHCDQHSVAFMFNNRKRTEVKNFK